MVPENIHVITLGDSSKCDEGETVVAAGTPMNFESSFTKGIISSSKRSLPFLKANLIQTDAAINLGNCDGPLINQNGEVIGINSLIMRGKTVEGIGFAVAINHVKHHIEKKVQMTDGEITQAIAREEKKMEEIRQYRDDRMLREEKRLKDNIIEEEWERERRRREFNEKVETAHKELLDKKHQIEKQLQEEANLNRKRLWENAELRRKALSECLQTVTNEYQTNWNGYCKKWLNTIF